MPKVSVIIPTYNRRDFVTKAIESVLSQRFHELEIILVDDGSTDGTRPALARYHNFIRYIYQDNAGASAARNTGIKAAQGEWLAFLDSDDEWTAAYLAQQIQRAQATPGICMQTTDCLFFGADGRTRRFLEMNGARSSFNGQDYLLPRDPFSFVIQHGPWQLGSTLIRRDVLSSAGMFDTSLKVSEDFDLMARVSLQGRFGIIREALVNIHRRDESLECLTQQARRNPLQARESDERLFQKLARLETLTPKQRKVLRAMTSANRRAMGNLLLQQGRITEARLSYQRAFSSDHSIKSLGRYVLSWSGLGPNAPAGLH